MSTPPPEVNPQPPRCPVCNAPFRRTVQCPRCGADLQPLMRLLADAWALRQQARCAIRGGKYQHAEKLARAAHDIQHTKTTKQLLQVVRVLV